MSTATRLLAYLLILLGLIPMASLYLLLFWAQHAPVSTTTTTVHESSSHEDSVSNGVTLEGVLARLLQQQMTNGGGGMISVSDLDELARALGGEHPQGIAISMGIMMPNLLSFCFGVLVPLVALMIGCIQRLVSVSGKRRRRKELMRCLEPYRKVLKDEDRLVASQTSFSDHNQDTSADTTQWSLPAPGTSLWQVLSTVDETTKKSMLRSVTCGCAICLTTFDVGDEVVWSGQDHCVHCFHQGCMVSWLLRKCNVRKCPCPCCRQSFVAVPQKTLNQKVD